MLIFFGWGKRTVKEYGDTYPIECQRCNNNTFYKLVHVRTWFTLFFIPVIPYESKYFLMCKICNNGYELSGDSIKRAKELNTYTTMLHNNELTHLDYKNKLEEINVFG